MKRFLPNLDNAVVAVVKSLATHHLSTTAPQRICACGEYCDSLEDWADHALATSLAEVME